MFSPELENLIKATLEDGILEEYEKEALLKRANAENVDPTELKIYINSLLQRRQRELNQQEQMRMDNAEQIRKENFGKRCPNCGRQVAPLTLVCQCGYEFSQPSSVNATEGLLAELKKLEPKGRNNHEKTAERKTKKMELIRLTPVPNTKEGIIDFLALSLANSERKGGLWGTKSGRMLVLAIISVVIFIVALLIGVFTDSLEGAIPSGIMIAALIVLYGGLVILVSNSLTFEYNEFVDIWRDKFEQTMLKGRSLRSDAEFQRRLDYFEEKYNKLRK